MNNILQTVKDAAIRLLKDYEPETDVYGEEIMRTDGTLDTGEEEDESQWYFVEVIPTSITTVNRLQTEVSLTVSIDYHEPGEYIRKYGDKAMALDGILRPVFRFLENGERRMVTVPRVNVNISGGMLHLTFPLVFTISVEDQEFPEADSLDINLRKG